MNGHILPTPKVAEASGTMTYAEFLRRYPNGEHLEWVEGKIVSMAPASDGRQDVAGFLYILLRQFAEVKQLGIVRNEPFQMKTGPSLPGRSPDVIFVSAGHRARMQKLYLKGPADLVVEIASDSTRRTDRTVKLREYESGGVPEYWVIDPDRREAWFYLLSPGGKYAPAPLDPDNIYRSRTMPGLWIQIDWLWQRPLPGTVQVLRQWGIV